MGADGGQSKAPTAVIETVVVVRPIKVIAALFGVMSIIMLLLNAATTAWITADGTREGLWEKCDFNKTREDWVHCKLNEQPEEHDWIMACQALCLISVIVAIIAIFWTSKGLRTDNFRTKYKFYWVGLSLFFVAAGFEILSLIVFPIMFLQEIPNRDEIHWHFGWSYIVGWAGALTQFAAGMFILLDRRAEEITYRERVVHEEEESNGIEASEDV